MSSIPTVIIATDGGLIQSVVSDGHVRVIEIGYDKDDVSVKFMEEPSRVSTIFGDEGVLYDWTDHQSADQAFFKAVTDELAKQKELHEYMRDKED